MILHNNLMHTEWKEEKKQQHRKKKEKETTMATCLMAWWVVRDLGRGNGYKSSSIICYPCLHACCDLILNFFGRRIDHDAIIINIIQSIPPSRNQTKPNQMGVHKLLPAVGPRRGRRLGRILRVALSFRLWLSLLALLCLLSFALFGLKFITLVGRGKLLSLPCYNNNAMTP